jgi:hypothetical protein
VTDNAPPTLGVGQIGMGLNMGGDFRFNRLGKQLPGTGPQNLRQRVIRKRPWLAKPNNCIFFHGVSFLRKKRRLNQRQDTPPSSPITKIRL